MEIPYTYFQDEVREGFYISGIMKRAWAAQMEVLSEVDRVCKKHGIRWFADCGTLIGTIRHRGYIPWDDDMDICMLRDDYEKFLHIAEEELPDGYRILNMHTGLFDFLTRIVNSDKICMDEDFLRKYHEFPFVAGIDIFPLDYLLPDEEEAERCRNLAEQILDMAALVPYVGGNDDMPEADHIIKRAEKMTHKKIDCTVSKKQQLCEAADAIFRMQGKEGAKQVVLAPQWARNGDHKYELSYFEDCLYLPFEVMQMPVPVAYDAVLRIEYGDYMQVVKKGFCHDYPYFQQQEDKYIAYLKHYPFRYIYNPRDVEPIERHERKGVRYHTEHFLALMKKIHMKIGTLIRQGRFSDVLDLLQRSQGAAVQIGNELENYFGEGFDTVHTLEEYCEVLYQSYVEIQGLERFESEDESEHLESEKILDQLECARTSIKKSASLYIKERKEVVFLPYRADTWSVMEPVWKVVKQHADTDVIVLLPPYYERHADGSFGNMHEEVVYLPEYVSAMAYDEYDFENRHPDMIITQNPYDEYNYTSSIHPFFYGRNLKQYTDQLIYMPWFLLDEPDSENEKAYQTMQYFCTVPGVICADQVVVQSEQMKKAYVNYLTSYAGVDTKTIWENKITGVDFSLMDKEQKEYVSEDSKLRTLLKNVNGWEELFFKETGERKKVILYSISVASIVQYREKLIDKIRRVIETFRQYLGDIAVIWMADPFIEKSDCVNADMKDAYKKEIEMFYKAGIGICDDTLDLDLAIDACDAYYGDAGYGAHRCRLLGKPVLLQNVEV